MKASITTPTFGYFVAPIIIILLSTTLALAQIKRSAPYDFTGDGTSDLLEIKNENNSIAYWDIKADKTIRRHVIAKKSPRWLFVGAGDYNGDGTTDILFRHRKTGAIGYWVIKRGKAKRMVILRRRTKAEWHVVSSRNHTDFDGDGRDDILLRRDMGELLYYRMTGREKQRYKPVFLTTLSPEIKVNQTGDFNADGRDDILWQDSANGSIGYFAIDHTILSSIVLSQSAQSWIIETIGDFRGDGYADLFGTTSPYFMFYGYWDINSANISDFNSSIPNLDMDKKIAPVPIAFFIGTIAGNFVGGNPDEVLAFSQPIRGGPYGRYSFLILYEFKDGTVVNATLLTYFDPMESPGFK